MTISFFDNRRHFAVPGDSSAAIDYCVNLFVNHARDAIASQGYFAVALSGGSTPKAVYKKLASEKREAIDWSKVWLFWSDERAVALTSPQSNYHMAMEAGLDSLPIPKNRIFPLNGEGDLEENARSYEKLIDTIPQKKFDLILLGMGEDGHTASLFPKTHGLHAKNRLVIANFLPEQDVWRLSVTFACINASSHINVYVLGSSKKAMVEKVFSTAYQPDLWPIQRVGTETNPALFIFDQAAVQDVNFRN